MATPTTRARWVLLSSAVSAVLIILISWICYQFVRPGVDAKEVWPLIRLILQGIYVVIVWGTFEMLRPYVNPRVT